MYITRLSLLYHTQAYRLGMMLPDYVWMFHNWYVVNWWRRSTAFNCTPDEIRRVLNFQIILDHYPRISEDDKNRTNIGGTVSKCL